jgi:CRISPR/Cas system-associated exonuclease Cas4 (RecB family)
VGTGRMYHVLREIQSTGTFEACRRKIQLDPVLPEWRGRSWETSPRFEGPYEPPLAIDEIIRYGGPPDPATKAANLARTAGRAYHALYRRLVDLPKARLLGSPPWTEAYGLADTLTAEGPAVADTILNDLGVPAKVKTMELRPNEVEDLRSSLVVCWSYEMDLLRAELRFHMNRTSSTTTADFAQAIPVEAEMAIDGSKLRLSNRAPADAFLTKQPTVVELKTGPPDQVRHRLAVTGYALALESQTGTDLDVGCVTYLAMRSDRLAPSIKCDVFPIDTDQRQRFIEWRNQAMFARQKQDIH